MVQDLIFPQAESEACDAVLEAVAAREPLEIVGNGSKRGLGRPMQVARALSMRSLAGIRLYEPNELVMSAAAGTPLAEIRARLADHGQHLAFEPPDWSALLGAAEVSTIGGVFACNLAGPRRVSAGAARDHLLGFRGISGRGEVFKAGGRVVKNVTGFDLCKLVTGSYGTLVALTELTFKVLPAPEKTRTVLVAGLNDDHAIRAMRQALQSCHEVSSAAHLPASVAAQSGVSYVRSAGTAVTAVRVEGPEPSVVYRCAALRRELGGFGETEELHGQNSRRLWQEIGDVQPFAGDDRVVWRLSVPPAAGAAAVAGIARHVAAEAFFDRGGGLVWVAVTAGEDGGAVAVRDAVNAVGGGAMLVRAPHAMRGHTEIFPPQPEPLRRLSARVKEAFDPLHIFNPGRMYAGI